MAALRYVTLLSYVQNEILAARIPDEAQRQARLRQMAETWGREFDPHSMLTLRKALQTDDVAGAFGKILARVLYVLSRTDTLFPPRIAPEVMDGLARAGVDAKYVEIDTE